MSRIALLCLAAVLLAGCGGSGSRATSSSRVVARVEHAQGRIANGKIVADARVRIGGGTPGRTYTLRWGIIDAVAGVRASDSEPVIARYTTTRSVETHAIEARAKIPGGTTAYLVHFTLDGPDGSFVSGDDSAVFQVGGS